MKIVNMFKTINISEWELNAFTTHPNKITIGKTRANICYAIKPVLHLSNVTIHFPFLKKKYKLLNQICLNKLAFYQYIDPINYMLKNL